MSLESPPNSTPLVCVDVEILFCFTFTFEQATPNPYKNEPWFYYSKNIVTMFFYIKTKIVNFRKWRELPELFYKNFTASNEGVPNGSK